MNAMTGSTMAPVGSGERIPALDILRGFALYGILLVNFYGSGATGIPDRIANFFLEFFVSGKFYPLYSFLFGLGFGVMLLRAQAKGTSVVPLYLRRLLILAAIGAAHYVLLWEGDILRYYAVLGVLLLLFRNRSPRVLLVAAIAALLVANFWSEYSLAHRPPLQRADPQAQYVANLDRVTTMEVQRDVYQAIAWAKTDGTYADLVAARARSLVVGLPSFFSVWMMQIFGMFLLGLYAARRRLFDDVARHRRLAVGIVIISGGLGLAGNFLLYAAPELAARGLDILPALRERLAETLWNLSGPAFTLAYVAGMALLCGSPRVVRRLAILAPVGRMGLTNYLMQSVVGTSLYYGYTFDLYGKVGPALGIGLSTLIFACQIPISHWWMARYRFGPAEWLWRSLTYMRPQPMRLEPPVPAPVIAPEASGQTT